MRTCSLGFSLLLFIVAASAIAAKPGHCFDFSHKVTKPLVPEPPYFSTKHQGDIELSGTYAGGAVWAAVRGVVDRPIAELLTRIEDSHLTSPTETAGLAVKKIPDDKYLLRQLVTVDVKPFLFVTVSWTVEWAFALVKGTKSKPERVVASYEKTDGTSHIQHLCGNIVLDKAGPDKTDVYLYEEAKATQRDATKTLHGLEGTLKDLRQGHADTGGPDKT